MRNLSVELRPDTFDSVIGSQRIILALKKQIEENKLSVAYMFYGPPGTGKTTMAYILGKAINGDVTERNCADENGVDDIRNLVSSFKYKPLFGDINVFILDEAQELTANAQKVLLTPLENPTIPVICILCTTDPQKIIPALKARCKSYEFKGISGKDRQELVGQISHITNTDYLENIKAIEQADITSPRDIIMSIEKISEGIPVSEAIANPEANPELIKIALELLSGKWTVAAKALSKIKTQDIKSIRQILSACIRNQKIFTSSLAGLSKELSLYSSPEPGIELTALYGIIYKYCNGN